MRIIDKKYLKEILKRPSLSLEAKDIITDVLHNYKPDDSGQYEDVLLEKIQNYFNTLRYAYEYLEEQEISSALEAVEDGCTTIYDIATYYLTTEILR